MVTTKFVSGQIPQILSKEISISDKRVKVVFNSYYLFKVMYSNSYYFYK